MMRFEKNYIRKAQRVTIPIHFLYKGSMYKVDDWSTVGLGIRDNQAHPLLLKEGDRIEGKIVLPTHHASILLDVTIELKNRHGDRLGFEIVEISEQNRRVLRHYATLAIEGGVDQVEDLIATLSSPSIDSPIKEPVELMPQEQERLRRLFGYRFALYAVALVVVLIGLGYLVVYNYVIVYRGTGAVSGNLYRIASPYEGEVNALFVHLSEPVFANMQVAEVLLLPSLEMVAKQNHRRKAMQEAIKAKEATCRRLAHQLAFDQEVAEAQIQALQIQSDAAYRRYRNLQSLYAKRLVTYGDLFEANERWLTLHQKLLGALKFFRKKEALTRCYEARDRLVEQLQRGDDWRPRSVSLVSHQRGRVYAILKQPKERVKSGEAVVLIQTDQKPFIIANFSNAQAQNIALSQPCLVRYQQEAICRGHIEAIGYASVGIDAKPTMDLTYQSVPVRIVLDKGCRHMSANARVRVWVLRQGYGAMQQWLQWLW